MQTSFTAQQLTDPDFAASERILRRCVHCGFCTATCPTYMLLGDELDGPRGRIYLIKEMLERGGTPAPETVKHVDRCLSCLSCVTTCPSGVDYMHLVDHARSHIEQHFERPAGERLLRWLLGAVLSRAGRFRAALRLAGLIQPLIPLLPQWLRSSLALAPTTLPPRGATEAPQVFAAIGPKRGRVALLSGCAQPVLAPSINDAAVRLLTRQGIEVVIARGAGCCGALNHHLGQTEASHQLASATIRAWQREIDAGGLDAIVTTTSGCGTMLKDYGYMFRNDPKHATLAQRISGLSRDISEYLITLTPQEQPPGSDVAQRSAPHHRLRIAYQSPCSMQHGQKILTQPIMLLAAAGFDVQSLPESHVCCGSAGTYNLLQPQISAQLRVRKQALIEAAHVDVVATGNIGCMTQLSQSLPIPIVHTVELLDWAAGGPRPSAIATR